MFIKRLSVLVCLLLLTALAAGCAAKPADTTPSATPGTSASPSAPVTTSPSASPSPSGIDQESAMQAVEALLKTEGSEKAAIDAILKAAPGLSPGNTAQLVLDFEKYQNDAVAKGTLISDALVKEIQSTMKEPYDEKFVNNMGNVQAAGLKDLQALFDRGYKIIIPEGNYEAVVNYTAYKSFEAYLPPDLAAYIEIMAAESQQRLAEDGSIIIPMDDVYARALHCESFLTKYPDSVKKDAVKTAFARYVDAYFTGFPNSPAFDSAKKLNQKFLDSYQKVAAGSTDSALAKAVSDYLKLVTDNGYKLTQAVTDGGKTITDTLKNI